MNARAETYRHIRRVNELLLQFAQALMDRAIEHDASKLEPPESDLFEASTERLAGLTYGSPEYKAALEELKPAIQHHYEHNRHHPEFHSGLCCIGCFKEFPRDRLENCDVCGNAPYPDDRHTLRKMTLVDVVEMLCDWKAATERHDNGDLMRSIDINQERFHYSDEVKALLRNTAEVLLALPRRTK